jgi:FkbM family methyltransferase
MLRMLGMELRKYMPQSSDMARMNRLLLYNQIDLVLDVGANKGQYAKYLREAGYLGRIVSFEPVSTAYAALLKASKKDLRWDVAPRAAIGNKDGEVKINISKNSESSSALPIHDLHVQASPNSAYIDSEIVKLYKLDSIAEHYLDDTYKAIYLKMDVQGFELQVLEGASRILPRVKMLQLELSLVPLYQGELLIRVMLDKVDALGYELYAVIPGFTDMKSGRLLQLDGIFIQK